MRGRLSPLGFLSCTAVAAIVTSLTAAPAQAAPRVAASHVVVHITPATAHIRSTVVLTGSVTPKVTGLPVTLQRYVGKTWRAVGKAKVSKTGTYTFSVKTPGTPTNWLLRVTRAATAKVSGGISATAHVRVVKPIFVVKATLATATVVTGAPLVVTGTVRPKTKGKVTLQALTGRTWHSVTSVALTKASSFKFSTVRPAGAYRLRVIKPYTLTVAGGISAGLTATVSPPVAPPIYPPVVSTVSLPTATIGVPYTATLAATSGVTPYTWTSTALPAGLSLSAAGVISGTPTAVGAQVGHGHGDGQWRPHQLVGPQSDRGSCSGRDRPGAGATPLTASSATTAAPTPRCRCRWSARARPPGRRRRRGRLHPACRWHRRCLGLQP